MVQTALKWSGTCKLVHNIYISKTAYDYIPGGGEGGRGGQSDFGPHPDWPDFTILYCLSCSIVRVACF